MRLKFKSHIANKQSQLCLFRQTFLYYSFLIENKSFDFIVNTHKHTHNAYKTYVLLLWLADMNVYTWRVQILMFSAYKRKNA